MHTPWVHMLAENTGKHDWANRFESETLEIVFEYATFRHDKKTGIQCLFFLDKN